MVFPDDTIRYWHDKAGREVDFSRARQRHQVDAIECKWDPGAFDATSLKLFPSQYPKGRNYLLTH